MGGNLRDRLRRIQKLTQNKKSAPLCPETDRQRKKSDESGLPDSSAAMHPLFGEQGWVFAGFQVLKRELTQGAPFDFPADLPCSMPIVAPGVEPVWTGDCAGEKSAVPMMPAYGDFLFFDLETTGLSGGAGTVAFLAAFGRFIQNTNTKKNRLQLKLHITQYLLLDYPGENDFLKALLEELKSRRHIVVTFNGKCFDSQILKNRCLMNGIQPPLYSQADLLHPARRLWKRLLNDCCQGTIETSILGIDRTGDIPGAMAPDIWFSFLKNNDAVPLLDICDHNRRDVAGLASIFWAMIHIAADPFSALEQYHFDIEQLALRWRDCLRRDSLVPAYLHQMGNSLLRMAAEQGWPKASLAYAMDLIRSGDCDSGRALLFRIIADDYPANISSSALRTLALDSEWRLGNLTEALAFAERGTQLSACSPVRQGEFRRRIERLKQKLGLEGENER
jgi:uncharacterized protein YprB with RNaseH-like and TPR domain